MQITVNTIPNGVCPVVHANQYDLGRAFIIKFKAGTGIPLFAEGTTFELNGRKPDNHVFKYTEADKWDSTHYIINKNGVSGAYDVTINTTEQMTAVPGDVITQLVIKINGHVEGTLNFIIRVQEQPYANGDPSGSELPSIIAEATVQMEAAEASAQRAEAAVQHYPYINSTNKHWMVWDAENEEWDDTGVRAQGVDGTGAVSSVDSVLPDVNGDVPLKWGDMSSISNLAIMENTRTMTSQRVAGSYVFVKADDQLYEVTTTIAANGTLTPGTNATAKSVADVLTSLNINIVYKFYMTLSDTTAKNVPSDFRELLLVGKFGNQRVSQAIPKAMLTNNTQMFIWGTDSSTRAAASVTLSDITASGVWYNDTAQAMDIDVYYR